MQKISLSTGKSFSSSHGSSILDAATASQIALPYSCKSGRCSACKCKIISGKTILMSPEQGLTPLEQAEGWILSCVRSAQTDLELEVTALSELALPPAKTLPSRISRIDRLAPDVIRVILRLPPATSFSFLAGQYINVIGPEGIRRSYSLANAPAVDNTLELHIRAVEGGRMSNYWFNQAKENDLLRLNGPLGTFFLRETTKQNLVFLATGTGIAPVKAMLETLCCQPTEQQPTSVTVLWGGRTSVDHYIDLPGLPGNYKFIPVQSRPVEGWLGEKGYVHEVLLQHTLDLSCTVVYACGSDAMIHSAQNALIEAGLPAKNFFADAFVSSENIY